MPDKTRFSLALILLFIAPFAWGQTYDISRDCETGGKITSLTETVCDGKGGPTLSITNGTFIPPPSCEPGWELVIRLSSVTPPLCAWILKEPIYK